MLSRILKVGLGAGLLAGFVLSGLQWAGPLPLIHEAELYEAAGHEHGAASDLDAAHSPVPSEEAWAPAPGEERTGFTLMANLIAAIAFGLMLNAAIAAAGRRIGAGRGLLWGLGGFLAFSLAPALGLPPELPGSLAADLADRQAWWLLAVTLTAAGLAAIVFGRRPLWIGLGLALIAIPHLVGAPAPPEHAGAVPPELAQRFVVAALATSAVFWLVLGGFSGLLWSRLARTGK